MSLNQEVSLQLSMVQLYARLHEQGSIKWPNIESLLAFDPGETTGWAYFEGLTLVDCGQLATADIRPSVSTYTKLIAKKQPQYAVMEEYRVYAWKAKEHSGSTLVTARLIGVLETLMVQQGIPFKKQSASVGKAFMTDDRLKSFGMYKQGQKHARDAIRHGCQCILFNGDFRGA